MANKTRTQSENTSTFLPGGSGSAGSRAPVTFFTDSDLIYAQSMSFTANIDSSLCTICYNYQNVTPQTDDYIMYSTANKTYFVYITQVKNNVYQTEIIDCWNTQDKKGDDTNLNTEDIQLSISCKNYKITHRSFTSDITINVYNEVTADNLTYDEFEFNDNSNKISTSTTDGLRFTITSMNEYSLGSYKIQIEFMTINTSPRMDTMIADKFILPNNYPGYSSRFGIDRTGEEPMFTGYMTNYSAIGLESPQSLDNSKITSLNFDNERLDNFTITVKDYEEGVGLMSYTSNIILPVEMFRRFKNDVNSRYKANMYIYIIDSNNNIHKVWMKDCTSMLSNIYK